jgi:peptidoglycan/xylan/chitin deacetylase (PgdA/CDA1 family)
MYHHIGKINDNEQEAFFVDVETFTNQLDWLLEKGYHPVSLSEVEKSYLERKALPERSVMLTFDDGYLNNYEYAYPLAVAKKIPITIFLSTGFIGEKEEMLTWAQVKEMQNSGWVEFASHGVNHKRLRKLSDSEIEMELLESKNKLEEITGKTANSFCYPYGAFDKRVRRLVFKAGYQMDFGTRQAVNRWMWNAKRPLKRFHYLYISGVTRIEKR